MLRLILAAWALAAAAFADQTVEVHVVNAATGAGIPDVALKFLQSGQYLYAGATGANGLFRIEAATEGAYTVLYKVQNFWPAEDSDVIIHVATGAEPVRREIAMYPIGKISGRVLDAAGKPVPNATLYLDLVEVGPAGGMGWMFEADEKGDYRSDLQRPGTWILAPPAAPGALLSRFDPSR